jgi:hemolysin III
MKTVKRLLDGLHRLDRALPPKPYTLGEEIANSITHGIGAGLSIAGLTVLVVLAALQGDVWRVVSFSIYGSTLVLLYLASTLYHSFQSPRVKRVFQIFDHSAIYLLIAGTYTPFLLVSLRGPWGWSLFAVVWGIALLGIAFKALFIHRFHVVSTLGYILMGWLGVVAIRQMLEAVPPAGLIWLAAGGVLYTIGVIFLAIRRIPYNHTIWHFFVLGGSLCHYFAVLVLLG